MELAIGALALGDDVNLYLAMDGACWAFHQCSADITVPGDRPVSEYIGEFLELGGRILLCSRCAEGLCGDECPSDPDMRAGVVYVGTATIAELAGKSIVYTF